MWVYKCGIENIVARQRFLPYIRQSLFERSDVSTRWQVHDNAYISCNGEIKTYHELSILPIILYMDSMFELCRFADIENAITISLLPTRSFRCFASHTDIRCVTVMINTMTTTQGLV
jgi:hypothetical protein